MKKFGDEGYLQEKKKYRDRTGTVYEVQGPVEMPNGEKARLAFSQHGAHVFLTTGREFRGIAPLADATSDLIEVVEEAS